MSSLAGDDRKTAKSAIARPPTIVDLAEFAGVSKTTVSRVLNGAPNVAADTRSRVLEAVGALGFQVNYAARTLRTSRTGLVGFLVPVISVFGLIVEALDRQLAADGMSILLTSSRRRDAERDLDAIETLVGRGVDALVIAPSDDRSSRLAKYLQQLRPPIVFLDREVRGVAADAVLIDQGPGITGAVDHLVRGGRNRIGLLTRDRRTRAGRQIIREFERCTTERGFAERVELIVEFDDLDRDSGRIGVDRLLEARADAIISTGTMEHTASVLGRLGEIGVRVPAQLSLVVYGHMTPSASLAGSLPTVAYPVEKIALAVRRLLILRLASLQAPPRVEVVQTSFLDGGGSAHR
jgi:LacI family transcriptional regulator